MALSTEELLKRRDLVIADYPFSDVSVGDIITARKHLHPDTFFENLSKYSANFRKLSWWENRDIEDMPEYLKYQNNRNVMVVYPAKFSKEDEGWTCHVEGSIIPHGNYLNDKFPSDKTEYESFINYKK